MAKCIMVKYVVAFDIHSNRARYRVNKIIGSWGQRVQKSVYEISIPDEESTGFQLSLKKLMGESDSIRFYHQTDTQKVLCLGNNEVKISSPKLVVY
ncbi:MAG: CRISPR-associated endonuclease Cas2 [Candidatus Marinimicrobia bacterium]|nr:CRISPR-associated endonuclease Cas2 [Candidatus Neomarinimicrobiota bacterium]